MPLFSSFFVAGCREIICFLGNIKKFCIFTVKCIIINNTIKKLMTRSQSCVASNFDQIKDVMELGSGWLHKIPNLGF